MDKLVQSLGTTTLIKSRVSEMLRNPDEYVEPFHTRLLDDAGPFTFNAGTAVVPKVREGSRVVGV